jgi:hypothetical protein
MATATADVTAKPRTDRRKRLFIACVVTALFAVLSIELLLCIRHESQTWDEACHIFAGYSYWTRGDFGMNPEHPPLVKLLATVPLLNLDLRVPAHPKTFSKEEDFLSATEFVYQNDAERILFRTRAAVATLTVLLAFVLFVATKRMFGIGAALFALFLLVFEPNILAHGMVVTTDVGLTLLLFATVYGFYRYVQSPSLACFGFTSMAAGFALATKHSGILVFPILIALATCEVIRGKLNQRKAHNILEPLPTPARRFFKLGTAIMGIGLIAGAILWAFYGFHLEPRSGVDGQPRLMQYAAQLQHPIQAKLIVQFAKWHLLPESYLYGLADVGVTAEFSHSYLLGKIYPHGKWFYFPVAFAIKSTLPLLVLLVMAPIVLWKETEYRRELIFLLVPAVIYFLVAMTSGMNIGVRHILPVYPFLIAIAGWTASTLIHRRRQWVFVIVCLFLFAAASSLHAFPVYVAYSNEMWGGPSQTYKYLSDSNVDWGQQLKATKKYLNSRHVDHCWFAYFADVVVDSTYYGIPCKPLTTIASVWLQPSIEVPANIDGPVLISAGVLSGYEFGPGALNPYDQFQRIQPTAVIEDGIFVFDGKFDIPLASSRNHVTRAQLAMQMDQLDRALDEAQSAVTLAPDSVPAQSELGDVLTRLNRTHEAQEAYARALSLAQTVHPEFQSGWVPGLRDALAKH